MSDPLARHVEVVAAERGASAGPVRAAIEEMQSAVREYPGVADLVFEYRRAFSHDPLVARTPDAHFLLVPPRVWSEFAARHGWDDDALAAVRAVHRAAFDEETALPDADRGDWEPLVLVAVG